jgi:methyl-accepting chemotaxis protein
MKMLLMQQVMAAAEAAKAGAAKKAETAKAVDAMNEGVREIDIGAGFAVQAGVNLRKIVTGAQKVTEMISQIAVAVEKQSETASTISGLVGEVSGKVELSFEESKRST